MVGIKGCCLGLILSVGFLTGIAQESPKLGLVLSGGGAKGVAHIGVLKAMEQAGLRPDYIAGTSMGSVIAALYALGYSADQIESIILEVDWDQVLSNEVPLNYISFEEKEYYNRYLAEFPIEKGQVVLGSGLIKGQMLNELLHRYLWPAYQYENFDQFPIPYRCLATDVTTGESIIFKDGPLPTAVRASMAIPTAFTAVDLDSTLAVDGGVLNNFPVEVVRAMGADYVIGVNVGSNLRDEGPESMAAILMSLATIPSTKLIYEQIEDCDVYLQPDISAYSTSSFHHAPEILKIGKEYGQKQMQTLKDLAAEIGMKREPYAIKLRPDSVVFSAIKVSGNSLFSDQLILNKLGIPLGKKVSRAGVEEGIRRVYGINGFSKVNYEIHPRAGGAATLEIKLREKLPTHLSVSLHLDNIFSAGAILNLTSRNLLGKESRSIFALDISRNPRFRFDYYKYTSLNKKLALNLRYDYLAEQLPLYEEGRPQDVVINRINYAQLNIMTTQSLRSSVSIGTFYEHLSSRSRFNVIAPESIKQSVEEQFGLRFRWMQNSLDNRNFPTRGREALMSVSYILWSDNKLSLEKGVDTLFLPVGEGGDVVVPLSQNQLDDLLSILTPSAYLNFQYSWRRFFPLGARLQLQPRGVLGFTLGNAAEGSLVERQNIGGWPKVWSDDVPALGLHYSELRAANYGVLGFKLQHVFYRNFFFRYGADLIGHYRYLAFENARERFNSEEFIEENLLVGFGTELSWRTRLGPVSAGVSSNTRDGYLRYYFAMGFSFNYSD